MKGFDIVYEICAKYLWNSSENARGISVHVNCTWNRNEIVWKSCLFQSVEPFWIYVKVLKLMKSMCNWSVVYLNMLWNAFEIQWKFVTPFWNVSKIQYVATLKKIKNMSKNKCIWKCMKFLLKCSWIIYVTIRKSNENKSEYKYIWNAFETIWNVYWNPIETLLELYERSLEH